MSAHTFLSIIEDACCSPDTTMTDAELAARYKRYAGKGIRVATVTRHREAFEAERRNWTGVHVGSMRLPR